MTVQTVDIDWKFNRGQWPAFDWKPERPGEPCMLAMKGAWRSGKSTAVFRRFTQHHLDNPGLRSLVVRRTYPELKDTLFPWIWYEDENPDNWKRLGIIKKVNQDEMTIWLTNGGRVDFRSALKDKKEDPAKFGSIGYGLIWIEEASEITHKTFLTLKGRLSQMGMPLEMLLSFNPPTNRHWLHDEFVKVQEPQRQLYTLSMEDNREYLPKGYIESHDHMPPSWRKRYVDGEWGILTEGDPVHPNYDERKHVSEKPLMWDKREPIIRGWDGSVTAVYFACTWKQLQRNRRLFTFKTRIWINAGVANIKKDVLRLSTTWFPEARFIDFGDPAMQDDSQIEMMSVADKLLPEINLMAGARAFTARREALDEWLVASVMVDGQLVPAYQIDPGFDTEMLRDGLAGGYHIGELAEEYDKRPMPVKDEYSHICEAHQYGVTGLELVRWEGKMRDYERRKVEQPVASWMSA